MANPRGRLIRHPQLNIYRFDRRSPPHRHVALGNDGLYVMRTQNPLVARDLADSLVTVRGASGPPALLPTLPHLHALRKFAILLPTQYPIPVLAVIVLATWVQHRWHILGATAMLTALGLLGALWLAPAQPSPPPFVPSLDLTVQPVRSVNGLSASTLLGTQSGVDILEFSEAELNQGVMLPKDKHLILHCSSGPVAEEKAESPLSAIRFWLYEYSGREVANLREGKIGRALLDGRFYISQVELDAGLGHYDDLPYFNELSPQTRVYAMLERDLYFRCGSGLSLRPPASHCGNTSVEIGEDCDDGNQESFDGCSIECIRDFCDDSDLGLNPAVPGFVREELTSYRDQCLSQSHGVTQTVRSCAGTGCLQQEAFCWSGDSGSVFGVAVDSRCPGSCEGGTCESAVVCGDGRIELDEQCDDHNHRNGDGCSAGCFEEPSYNCTDEPSRCEVYLPSLEHAAE